jgi:hypothetical protein
MVTPPSQILALSQTVGGMRRRPHPRLLLRALLWRRPPNRRPMARIAALNAWMKDYAAANGHLYLDFFTAMIEAEGL